jgi:hypothetical protein
MIEKELAERKRKAYLDPEKAAEHKNKGNELFKAGMCLHFHDDDIARRLPGRAEGIH